MKLVRYLHIDSNGVCRVTARRGDSPGVAFQLNIEMPQVWGSVDIGFPSPGPATISVVMEEPKPKLEDLLVHSCRSCGQENA